MKRKKKILIWKLLMLVFILGFVILSVIFVTQRYRQRKAEEYYQALQETAEEAGKEQEPEEEAPLEQEEEPVDILKQLGIEIPQKDLDFSALQQENPDIYAWIYVPGTDVDYPVLQHPTDDTYYLEYNLDGSKGLPGCIYTEMVNSKDFTDPHTVLYGHNMKNGTMFATLHNFEDKQVFEEYPYFYIYTPEKTYVYHIFAAYEYNAIHLIYNFDLSNREIFQNYLNQIFEIRDMKANIRQDEAVDADNRIVTLSTCVTGEKNKRYLVQGVLLNDEKMEKEE